MLCNIPGIQFYYQVSLNSCSTLYSFQEELSSNLAQNTDYTNRVFGGISNPN
jgi:hypothetical protein